MRRPELIEMFSGGGVVRTGQAGGGFWSNEPSGDASNSSSTPTPVSGGGGKADTEFHKEKSGISGANIAQIGLSLADMGISAIDTGKHTGGRRTVGGQTASAAVKGASLGLSVGGPWGALIGGVLGAGYGLITGSGQEHKARREIRNTADRNFNYYNDNTLQANIDPYGDRYEDGGATGDSGGGQLMLPSSKPSTKVINIEKGELMIDPMSMNVVQKFTNPNRFSAHQPSQMDEAIGNFVSVPDDMVIIPKKLAGRYERGDKLTRKSIVMNILSDQAIDPNHNKPAVKFASGGYTGPGDQLPVKPRKKFIIPDNMEPYSGNLVPPGPFSKMGPEYVNVGTNKMGRPFMTKVDITAPVAEEMIPENNTGANTNNEDQGTPGSNGPVTAAKGKRFNSSMFARTLLQNAPIIDQLLTGASGDPYLHRNPNVQMNTAISYAHQLPEDISIASQLAANDRSFMLAAKAIDNNDTPSVRAEKAALLAEKFAGDNNAYMGRESMRTQLKSTKLQTLLGLTKEQGADWQQDERYLTTELRMDAAARDNIRGAALSNLSENLMQGQNDAERLKAINTITHSVDIDPFAQKMIKEDPGFLPFMYDYILGGKGDYLDAKNEFLSGRKDKNKTTTYDKTVTNPKGGQTTTKGTKTEKTR